MSDDLRGGEGAVEPVLGALLDKSRFLEPDEVPAAVREAARGAGFHDVELFVADKHQRLLVPLGHGDDSAALDIDRTMAGQTYRTSEAVVVERGGMPRAWFPLLDGASRIGVMGAQRAAFDEETLAAGQRVAGLASSLLVTKSSYGDNPLLASRLKPLTLAAEMRWSLLPPLAFLNDRLMLAGFLEPAYDIAGDAFDYAINGDVLHVAIFDAVGHGLTASRMANLAVLSYRHSRRLGFDLEETYRAMDGVIAREFGLEAFVTAQLVRLDLPTGEIRWINAGHPRPLVQGTDRSATELEGHISLPVGQGTLDAEVGEAVLERDDTLLLYSDGVTEARSPTGQQFGREQLIDFFAQAASATDTLPETMRRLAHAVLDHQHGRLDDDATLLMVARPS